MNHYQTLQVHPQATQQEIKSSYRRLAKRFHPDHHQAASCEQIIALNAAYEILGNVKSRRLYDRQQQLGQASNFVECRQARDVEAQRHYRRSKSAAPPALDYQQWLQTIYRPTSSLISKILQPLPREIDELSADPFDDELMEKFSNYLETCHDYWQQAQNKLASQPNPPQVARVAADLYYCLNHLGDGIKELQFFTYNYNDHYLHTGQEIFRIAHKLHHQAQSEIRNFN